MAEKDVFKEFAREVGYPYFVEPDEYRHYDLWQAACAYQRKKDAEICRTVRKPTHDVWETCAQAIEEQE